MVVADLDHLPERHVRIVAMLGHVERRHPERIGLELERLLSAEEGLAAERIDFRDLLVGHRVAAARGAVAMHHQLRAGVAERRVIGVGIAGVEGEIVGRRRIHQAGRDRVETFRRLTVAFPDLGSEVAGPAADRVSFQERKLAGAVLLPDLEFGFLLEQADQDRRLQIHVLVDHRLDQLRRDRLVGLGVGGERDFIGVAAGQKRTRGGKCRRGDERADQRAIDQG